MIPETPPSHPVVPSSLPAPARPEAWEEIFQTHATRVRNAVRHALRARGERSDADRVADLEQEVWCRLLERQRRSRAGPRWSSEGETASYLRRVALTVVVDALRVERSARRRPPSQVPFDAAGRLADRRADPERRLLALETLRGYFRLCVELLGSRGSAPRLGVLRLAWVLGHSSREIAARLGDGWTVSGVDSLLFRLRRRLRSVGAPLPVRPGHAVRNA